MLAGSRLTAHLASHLDKAGGEEAVHAATIGPEDGKRAEEASAGEGFGQRGQFFWSEGGVAQVVGCQCGLDARDGLLGLLLADGVDQTTTGTEHGDCCGEQLVLRFGQ